MNKLFLTLVVLLISTVSYCNVYAYDLSEKMSNQIKTWVATKYVDPKFHDDFKIQVYADEVTAYAWIQENANNKTVLKEVMLMYPPKLYGYNMLKLMYRQQLQFKNDKF